MIRVERLRHQFGDRTVLDEISFEITKGEVVAVMGASGGGKTTLLRILTGLLRPTAGVVRVFDTDLASAPSAAIDSLRPRLGVVFQSAALFDFLSVFENVAFALRRRERLKGDALKQRVAEKLAMVGLQDTENLMPDELSGGMKKRVAVARALATNPELLFYDEPTSGLDPVTRYALDQLIRQVNDATGATSVVVSHDLHSVLRTANRVLFLHEGKLLADEPVERFKSNPSPIIQEIIQKAEAEALV
jgi:phospholipid/cholesterol/gamma-HCH transport system ATP-binding protein